MALRLLLTSPLPLPLPLLPLLVLLVLPPVEEVVELLLLLLPLPTPLPLPVPLPPLPPLLPLLVPTSLSPPYRRDRRELALRSVKTQGSGGAGWPLEAPALLLTCPAAVPELLLLPLPLLLELLLLLLLAALAAPAVAASAPATTNASMDSADNAADREGGKESVVSWREASDPRLEASVGWPPEMAGLCMPVVTLLAVPPPVLPGARPRQSQVLPPPVGGSHRTILHERALYM